jgi:hypothetical protein
LVLVALEGLDHQAQEQPEAHRLLVLSAWLMVEAGTTYQMT